MALSLISSHEELRIIIPVKVLGRAESQNLFFIRRFGYDTLLTMVIQAVALKCNLSCTTEEALLFRCNHQRLREIITNPRFYPDENSWLNNAFYQLHGYLEPCLSQRRLSNPILVKVQYGAITVQLFKV